MPLDVAKAEENWMRYRFARDNGHLDFVRNANMFEQYFYGNQWRDETRAKLNQQFKPVITVNKIWASLLVVMGEQLQVQGDVAFEPTASGDPEVAEVLTKVYRSILRSQEYQVKEAEVFDSGIIRGRGFFDVRLNFDDQMRGEVKSRSVNSKNVIIDPDAWEYDPDTWKEVFYTQWMTANEIKTQFNHADGAALEQTDPRSFRFGIDSTDSLMNTFGGAVRVGTNRTANLHPSFFPQSRSAYDSRVRRIIRVVERQFKDIDNRDHFVDRQTGDARPIPEAWDEERIREYVQAFNPAIIKKRIERIRFMTTADDRVLFDDWGPFNHFTFVPYFPFFHEGRAIGLVENLVSPQDMLNKTLSQELHVVNTTANSGWQMEEDQLSNMDPEELEQRGAETGIVLVRRRGTAPLEKIEPNNVPTGLDRMTFKADEFVKELSGASDSKRGFDRADVSGKAIRAKQFAGSVNFAKALFNLVRTRKMMAKRVLHIVQGFYDEERVFRVAPNGLAGEAEEVRVNIQTPGGEIVNDLTLGEYDVAITDVPLTDTYEESQFDEALRMRELGVAIPDDILIEASKLTRKNEIAQRVREANGGGETSAAEQKMAELEMALKEAEVETKKATSQKQEAEAAKAIAEAQMILQEAQTGGQDGAAEAQAQAAANQVEMQQKVLELQHMERMTALKEQELKVKIELERRKANEEIRAMRVKAAQDARIAREKASQDAKIKQAKADSASKESPKK
jgi:hypothetical protein